MLANKHIEILATLSNKKMIQYNSLEVSEKLFCHEPGVLWYYETTALSLHHNCIYSSGRVFVLYKWQGRLFKSLKLFSRPFYLLENVIFFTKPTGFCAITESSLENIACVLHSLQFTLPTLLQTFLILSAIIYSLYFPDYWFRK